MQHEVLLPGLGSFPQNVFARGELTIRINSPDWQDLVFCKNDGAVRLYFIRTQDDEVKRTIPLLDNVVAGVDADDKIRFISFLAPDRQLACHTWDHVHCDYAADADVLTVYFVTHQYLKSDGVIGTQTAKEPYENDILFDVTPTKRILSVEILFASDVIKKQSKSATVVLY